MDRYNLFTNSCVTYFCNLSTLSTFCWCRLLARALTAAQFMKQVAMILALDDGIITAPLHMSDQDSSSSRFQSAVSLVITSQFSRASGDYVAQRPRHDKNFATVARLRLYLPPCCVSSCLTTTAMVRDRDSAYCLDAGIIKIK